MCSFESRRREELKDQKNCAIVGQDNAVEEGLTYHLNALNKGIEGILRRGRDMPSLSWSIYYLFLLALVWDGCFI